MLTSDPQFTEEAVRLLDVTFVGGEKIDLTLKHADKLTIKGDTITLKVAEPPGTIIMHKHVILWYSVRPYILKKLIEPFKPTNAGSSPPRPV